MAESFAAAFRRARVQAGLSIRAVSEATGVSTATVQRAEADDGAMRAGTVHKLADAVGIPHPVLDESGERWIAADLPAVTAADAAESRTVVTDGRNVLVLDVPPGFLDGLDEDEVDEIRQDALLEVMRLARAAKRDAAGDRTRGQAAG